MYDNDYNSLSMFDGICDQTRELKTVSGKMPHDEKWVISSSGSHMFIHYHIQNVVSRPGFHAQIHYGNKINNLKLM